MNWREAASKLRWRIEPYVGGDYCASVTSEIFETVNPADETVLSTAPIGSLADVDAAVCAARQCFEDGCWSEISAARRGDALAKLADLLVENKVEIALLDTLEMGKPIQASLHDAEFYAPLVLRSWAALADKLLGSSVTPDARTVSLNTYQPRGVVGAITPWNFPVVNAVMKVAPALAAGNTVVLKPSEVTPSSALKLAELAVAAGVPPGVFNVVPGVGSTVGAALAAHPDVDLLSFTGSTLTGRRIIQLSGSSNGKPLLMECGGKSPFVVFDDVRDLERVADAAVQSVVRNQGQVCSAHTRLIVQETVYDRLLELVLWRAAQYHPGHPLNEGTTFGPLSSPSQRNTVKRYIDAGLREGARAALMGAIQERGGCYVSPTIFVDVRSDMSIVREEIFGPVLCVQRFKNEEEAIALANSTDYGLVAMVWTRDLGRGKRVAHAIKAGYVSVRTSGEESICPIPIMSFEPQKASGFGSEIGLRGLESYSTLKAISFSGA